MANQYTSNRGLGKGSATLIARVSHAEKAELAKRLNGLTWSDYMRVRLGLRTSGEIRDDITTTTTKETP